MKKKTPSSRAVAPRKTKPNAALTKNERHAEFANGLAEAVLGFNPGTGIGGGINPYGGFGAGGSPGTSVNQVNTMLINNRWYFISNFRQELSEGYVEHGLIQTVCDVPVDDGLRGGVTIKTKQLSAQQVEQLETEMERQDDLGVVAQALKWNRLFGGAGIMVLTDQDPKKPLNVDQIRKDSNLEFRAVDMWELFWDKQNTESYNMELQQSYYEFYNYYAKVVHKSRVMKMTGLVAPSFLRPRLRGWGFSVVEAIVVALNQYFKSNNLIFEVLDEFKIDVYKIKNLTNTLLTANGTQQIHKRVALANQQKSFQSAIVMDAEDDFAQKELLFTGIKETLEGIRMQVASSLRMPLSKLFGTSATGFGSGEDDIENYNMMIESQVRQKSKYDILKIIELRCQKLFEFVPDDISIEFQPLRILNAEQEENVKTQKFSRIQQARAAGEITSLEYRNACNKDMLLEIQLETDSSTLSEIEDEQDEMTGAEDGANREDNGGMAATPPKGKKPKTQLPEAKD